MTNWLLIYVFLEPKLIGTPFSIVAGAALKLSMEICQPDLIWDNQLIYWSGLSESDIKPVVDTLTQVINLIFNYFKH